MRSSGSGYLPQRSRQRQPLHPFPSRARTVHDIRFGPNKAHRNEDEVDLEDLWETAPRVSLGDQRRRFRWAPFPFRESARTASLHPSGTI